MSDARFIARIVIGMVSTLTACFGAGNATAQTSYPCTSYGQPNTYISACADEGLAYVRATLDASAYFVANPKNVWGDVNQLCPTIKNQYNGPYTWIASIPTVYYDCKDKNSSYVNPVFRASFPSGQTCAARASRTNAFVPSIGSLQCNGGCEYVSHDNGDGTSALVPSGNVCLPPTFDSGKNNQCDVPNGPLQVGATAWSLAAPALIWSSVMYRLDARRL